MPRNNLKYTAYVKIYMFTYKYHIYASWARAAVENMNWPVT